jgi:hypothetical protein
VPRDEDACIFVANGRYDEDVRIARSMTLRGSGPGACRIVGKRAPHILTIDGSGSGTVSVTVEGLSVSSRGPSEQGGIHIRSASATLANIEIAGNIGDAIAVYNPGRPKLVRVLNCTVESSGRFLAASGPVDVTVQNCIFVGGQGQVALAAADRAAVSLSHYCFPPDVLYDLEEGGSVERDTDNAVNYPPRFAEEGGFQLEEYSPCIDAGAYVNRPFFGAAPDIGAYEFRKRGEE